MSNQRKAVALVSGGLDSMLAVQLMLDQGIHVEGLNFYTGFCVEGHTHAIRNSDKKKEKRNDALWAAEQLGIKLHIIDVIEDYKDIVINPKHGYGANLNPCLDCKGFMVGKAHEWMQQNKFDFIVTGEVIGQRPMSQRKDTMPVVARESGANDRLLRPLCAQFLPETLPEIEGWVDRQKLLNFSGRNRKPQIALAKKMGFDDFSQPSGGCCFLTDAQYSHKLSDLWQSRGERRYEFDDIMLLKVGRHLRPAANFKLIVARDDGENNFMNGYRKQFVHMFATSHKGPIVLIDGDASDDDLKLAARLTARFGQGKKSDQVEVDIVRTNGEITSLAVEPMTADDIPQEWYL